MSAFMVSTDHIDAMLTGGLDLATGQGSALRWWHDDASQWLKLETAGQVGAMLLAENRRSVDYRYREAEWEEPYLFNRMPGVPDPVTLLKAIHCYEYQSCEHPQWRDSEAYAFCRSLEGLCVRSLPGYDAAPWGIEGRLVFVAR